MKKTILYNILIIIFLVWSAVLVSHSDTRNYQRLLERGNIREGAVIFPSRSQQSIPQALQKLQKRHLDQLQIYFIQKKNPNVSYVYMPEVLRSTPITKGRFFIKSDFQSPIPFVILGKDLYQKAYHPQAQRYYQIGQRYYSVIGATGINDHNKLNQHIFISASPQQNNRTQIRHYQIVVDGPILNHPQKLKQLQTAFHARKPARSVNRINNIKQTWWTRWGDTLCSLSVTALVILILGWLSQIPAVHSVKASALQNGLLSTFKLETWFKFFLGQVITFAIAGLIAFNKVQIISWRYLFLYFGVVFILLNLQVLLQLNFTKPRKG
ncbi:hypothetical protein HU830_01215 [Lactobacillus sp. DCY120]|uniref:MacB-like periplasmic core domain-containing protein n=1 Tax=Bombilactobacillus apium TaxID=2675299 RepID=A0A850RAI3_9LACO|nr:hypothetical protein [Bombilactobacillus apium]NVY95828.1 hypothetical protein [Bombilactobacillus apium]